ncbi:translation factor [Exidia glandulosa HHB12029]|uniref:Threonylcarbamoyl-AMP synthase n=1 Tax=Exidia glandulosa HHB12029 TaxID=1314781 RepID=A0A165QXK7_EXIGL|nr:translation factor [Exidia glandulosa HHB12029]
MLTWSWARSLFRREMATLSRVVECDVAAISFDERGNAVVDDDATTSALHHAADVLRRGECVAFPTETVYGLGADALQPSAVLRIFSTKGRPADNPLIVHVSSRDMLHSLLPTDYAPSQVYAKLMDAFWPGPLTLLFPADPAKVPTEVTAGHATVGVRMPAHPVARALIAIADVPIAAPSANSSGKPSPTRALHVARDLRDRVPLVLDGGACTVGLESTVLDGLHEDGKLRILRPGGVTLEQIVQVLGDDGPQVLVHRRDYADAQLESAPTTPGMKYRHYSPSVPVILLRSGEPPEEVEKISVEDVVRSMSSSGKQHVGVMALSDSRIQLPILSDITWHQYPLGPLADPAVTAQRLFDGLLTLESEGVQLILVEAISEENEGLAVMNRISKAASATKWIK